MTVKKILHICGKETASPPKVPFQGHVAFEGTMYEKMSLQVFVGEFKDHKDCTHKGILIEKQIDNPGWEGVYGSYFTWEWISL